jgi:serine/threonine protein kinase
MLVDGDVVMVDAPRAATYLASGSFGCVFELSDEPGCVLKVMGVTTQTQHCLLYDVPDARRTAEVPEYAVNEIAAMRVLHGCPSVLPLLEAGFVADDLARAAGGGGSFALKLPRAVCDLSGAPPTEYEAARQAAACITHAVAAAHSRGVLHMDVKPANVLFNSDWLDSAYKLADWSLAQFLNAEDAYTPQPLCAVAQSLWYRAPELLAFDDNAAPPGYKFSGGAADVWSVGVCVLDLLRATKGLPPVMSDVLSRHDALLRMQSLQLYIPDVPQPARSFVLALCHLEPHMRLHAEAALLHPFLQSHFQPAPMMRPHLFLPPAAPQCLDPLHPPATISQEQWSMTHAYIASFVKSLNLPPFVATHALRLLHVHTQSFAEPPPVAAQHASAVACIMIITKCQALDGAGRSCLHFVDVKKAADMSHVHARALLQAELDVLRSTHMHVFFTDPDSGIDFN